MTPSTIIKLAAAILSISIGFYGRPWLPESAVSLKWRTIFFVLGFAAVISCFC